MISVGESSVLMVKRAVSVVAAAAVASVVASGCSGCSGSTKENFMVNTNASC